MQSGPQNLSPAEAARRLGVTVKALRVYEEKGLVSPVRTEAGWRTYGAGELSRAREIVALRSLGLSLRQIADVFRGDFACLGRLLEAHQAKLKRDLETLGEQARKVDELRARLARGQVPDLAELAGLAAQPDEPAITLDLPWPWGGETFELPALGPLTFLTGPLGSGKTRLAQCLASARPGGVFLGLERSGETRDAAHAVRAAGALDWLEGEGATISDPLRPLASAFTDDVPSLTVIDLVEHGLDEETQAAVISYLCHNLAAKHPLILMTRSTVILDLESLGPGDCIIYCPANHSPPMLVAPYPGSPGYEAVATCLAPPAVRARTEGVVVMRPPLAEQR
ncbi:MAG: MerR family transcriptional regulator [Pseudomonadota bacterium]